MLTQEDILRDFARDVIAEAITEQRQKGIRASGRSAESLREETTKDGADIYGADYFRQQEVGRGPGTWVNPILLSAWMKIRGIPPEALRPIQIKIHREGTDIHTGKRTGLNFTDIIDSRLGKLRNDLPTTIREGYRSEILDAWR